MKTIQIDSEYIKLSALLKLAEIAQSGGHAKILILSEEVEVNGEIATERGKKIRPGDKVQWEDITIEVV